jgi:D-lactate dehydrogenase
MATRAAGYDNIDLQKAKGLGMAVANVPEYSPYAIAEHAVALVLALNRKLIIADKQVHAQNFTVGNLMGFDLKGKAVGVIGAGRIGGIFLNIMHAFGCRLLANDMHPNEKLVSTLGVEYVDLDTLCKEADIISIHTCLTPGTKHMINERRIAFMRPGSMIINTSRGGCVDTLAVIKGLESGQLGYFGADVYEKERGVFFYDLNRSITTATVNNNIFHRGIILTQHAFYCFLDAGSIVKDDSHYRNCWMRHQQSAGDKVNCSRKSANTFLKAVSL